MRSSSVSPKSANDNGKGASQLVVDQSSFCVCRACHESVVPHTTGDSGRVQYEHQG